MQYFHPLFERLTGADWASIAGVLHILIVIPTVAHILLKKENEGSAVSWIGVVVLSPFLGFALYWMFGISTIKRQGSLHYMPQERLNHRQVDCAPKLHGTLPEKWLALMRAGCAIHHGEYQPANLVVPLKNGDEAYPRMLKAIREARKSIFLSTYIFDYDAVGRLFVDELAAAQERGVNVYVLIDGIWTSLSWRKTVRMLKRRNVRTARFLPKRFLSSFRFINLRNHRKILSVDGEVGFIGGMNISHDNQIQASPRYPVQDIHFEMRGPALTQINRIFVDDWNFSTNEMLSVPQAVPIESSGGIISRVLPDGPDADYRKLAWTLLSAINAAEKSIRIMTPYFIPDDVLSSALQAASLRGVDVEIIVPEKNNIPFFNWAMQAHFKHYIGYGVRIYESPPPFDHSKIFLVDDMWAFIGSSNWDARSLVLNFEINLECYDQAFNADLTKFFEKRKLQAREITELSVGPLQNLLNNTMRLFSPYL